MSINLTRCQDANRTIYEEYKTIFRWYVCVCLLALKLRRHDVNGFYVYILNSVEIKIVSLGHKQTETPHYRDRDRVSIYRFGWKWVVGHHQLEGERKKGLLIDEILWETFGVRKRDIWLSFWNYSYSHLVNWHPECLESVLNITSVALNRIVNVTSIRK